MHEHVTCKSKIIMRLAQSNLNITHHFKIFKHTSKKHVSLLKCKCDVMHEHLGSFKQNPFQKFFKNLINFEKPKKNFKDLKT